MTKHGVLATIAIMATSVSASAAVIASQDFNGLSDAGTFTSDSFAAGSVREQLTNAGSMNSGGGGMDFATYWTDTRGNPGPLDPVESGDFIGVNSFAGSDAPNVAPDGTPVASGTEHNFEFNDGDGLLELIFAPVDTSGYTNRMLSFSFWINDTGFETGQGGPDIFMTVIDPDDFTAFEFDGDDLETFASADDGTANWRSYTANLDALGLGPSVSLIFGVDTNAGGENVFIDDVLLTGDPAPIPLPAGFVLLAGSLGALGALRRRR